MAKSDEDVGFDGIKPVDPNDDAPSIEELLTASNWEARVADARLKRQKSIAEKHGGTLDDIQPGVMPAGIANKPRPWDAQEAAARQWTDLEQLPDTLPDNHLDEERRAKGALVLLTCCAALGFGVTLVTGIMIGMGVLSFVQPADIVARNAQPIGPVAPPVEAKAEITPDPVVVTLPSAPTPNPEVPLAAQLEKFGADIWLGPKDGPSMRLASAPAQSFDIEGPRAAQANAVVQDAAPHGISISSYRSDNLPFLQTAFSSVSAVENITKLAAPNSTQTPHLRLPAEIGGMTQIMTASALPTATFDTKAPAPFFDFSAQRVDTLVSAPSLTQPSLAAPQGIELASNAPLRDIPMIAAIFQPGPATPAPALRTQPPVPLTLSAKLGFVGTETQSVNLVLHAPDAIDQAALDGHAQAIETSGFGLSKIVRPGFKVSTSHLRFYNSSDRKVAQALAAEMGFELRDFTSTSAPKGLVEVWLEGGSVAKAPARKARLTKARPKTARRQTQKRRVDPVRRLRNELANKLRNGEHL